MSERDWIEWINRHQVLAGLMQLGIYVLCIVGFVLFWGCIAAIVGTLFG